MLYYYAVIIILLLILLSRVDNLDKNATEPMLIRARLAMLMAPAHNPSSNYAAAEKQIIEQFKSVIRADTGFDTVVITSGASESNAMVMNHFKHIVISAYEHSSIYKWRDSPNVTVVYPQIDGRIHWNDIQTAITSNTTLVSIMAANNETGVVNDIHTIGAHCAARGIAFHSDATQYFPRMLTSSAFEHCDAISGSIHKLGGPKGVGFLCLRQNTFVTPLIRGSQNSGLRGGTENIPGIAGALPALRWRKYARPARNQRLAAIINYLRQALQESMPVSSPHDYKYFRGDGPDNYAKPSSSTGNIHVIFISNPADPMCTASLPNTLLLSFVLHSQNRRICNIKLRDALETRGVQISIGSACNTGSAAASHVLHALRLAFIVRCGTIRVSIGDGDSVLRLIRILPVCLRESIKN